MTVDFYLDQSTEKKKIIKQLVFNFGFFDRLIDY